MNESYLEKMDKLRAKGRKLISQEISPKEHEYQMMDRVKKSNETWWEDHKHTRSLYEIEKAPPLPDPTIRTLDSFFKKKEE